MVEFFTDAQKYDGLTHIIKELFDKLSDMKAGYQYHRDCLQELLKRNQQQNLYLAIVGQVKRGKSTLLNALIGEEILPSSIIPVTAIPTFVRYGEQMRVDVIFYDSKKKELETDSIEEVKSFLAGYIVEKHNPENRLKVSFVNVYFPAQILKEGIILIDTPGIGSTYLHNTETTLNFVPECDAALFVTSVDPPVTEVELEFLKRLARHTKNVYFILNKIDYLSDEELSVSKKFLEELLIQNGFEGKIFPVSARIALTGKKQKDGEIFKQGNIGDLEGFIMKTIVSKKKSMIEESLSIKLQNIIFETITTMDLEIKSLKMPVEVLEQKLGLLKHELSIFEKEKHIILDNLEGERKRLHEQLEDYSSELSEKARTYLYSVVKENSVKAENSSEFYENSRRAMEIAIPGFFENENGSAVRFFEDKIKEITEFYNERINQMCNRIRQIVSGIFEIDYGKTDKMFLFEIARQPYWLTHVWLTGFQPFSEDFVDTFLPPSKKMKRIMMRIQTQIDELVMQNMENLRWSIFQSIDRFFLKFKNFFEKYFSEIMQSTSGLVDEILKEKHNHDAVEKEIKKLEEKRKFLSHHLAQLPENLIDNKK